MSSMLISSIVFALVFGGALLGIFLRAVLPEDYLSAETKDVVKLGMALVEFRVKRVENFFLNSGHCLPSRPRGAQIACLLKVEYVLAFILSRGFDGGQRYSFYGVYAGAIGTGH